MDSHFGLAPRAVDAFELTIIQLIRNSLDHGLERPAKRLEKGKPERGSIEFQMIQRNGNLEIRIADDGEGLMLKKIKEVAVSKGHIDDACVDFQKIAHQIFKPSVTTKTEVSTISGCGIGLEAARASLLQIGGGISIAFLDEPNFKDGCRFEFVIHLPKDQYCQVAGESKGHSSFAA